MAWGPSACAPPADHRGHWRCRFILRDPTGDLADSAMFDLLQRIAAQHRWMHVEKLQEFDGVSGFTMAQGED